MSLGKKSMLGFSVLNVVMIVFLIIDLTNLTSLESLATALTFVGIAITLSDIFYVKHKIITPLKHLSVAVRTIAEGNLQVKPLEVKTNDEIAELATTFF